MIPENTKQDNIEFVKEYGKSWKDINNSIFLWILTASLSLTFFFILLIANRDYEMLNERLSEQITQKYLQALFSEIRIEVPDKTEDLSKFYSNIKIGSPAADKNATLSGVQTTSNLDNTLESAGLNLADVDLPEALVAIKNKSSGGTSYRPIQPGETKSVEIGEVKPFDIWEAPVQRQGDILIEPVEELVRGSQFVRGWRDPDEISLAIQKKEAMIEYCFKREAKFFNDLQGYVVVRFIILHSGRVDPASVNIIKSTLRNKKIEMCIKKRLQSWRGFEELDVSNGSVAVVQKFIFD